MAADGLTDRLHDVRERIAGACVRAGRSPGEVTLIAVSKGFGAEAVRDAAANGVTDIGENRVQEALAKHGELANVRLTWHMIGHLQTNKVKDALQVFGIIHSLDSIHVAEAISGRALTPVPAFLEVNVAGEKTKSGLSLSDLPSAYEAIGRMPNLDIRGLMTVAPLVGSPETVRPVFRRLAAAAQDLGLSELSMGMTDDFEVAIEEGATHIRIGRAIFGERA